MVKPWARLDELVGKPSSTSVLWILGGLGGILLPLQILICGWILQFLASDSPTSPASLEIGESIRIPSASLFADGSRLKGIAVLVGAELVLVLIFVLVLWLIDRLANSFAIDRKLQLLRAIFRKSGQLACVQSISGQHSTLQDAIATKVPRIRRMWEQSLRMVPRYVVQAIAGMVIALCIHPAITLLAVVSLILLWQLYRVLDLRERTTVPVIKERIQSLQARIQELCESGPLLSFAHADEASEQALEVQLRSLQVAEHELVAKRSLVRPVTLFLIGLFLCFVGFVLAIRIVHPESQLHASSALIFFGSLFASAYACIRLIHIRTEYQETSDKVQAIVQLLSQLEKDPLVSGQEALPAIQKRISLDHVTLRDSEGRRLLEDVCMDMEPGKLVAIIGSDRLQARAVAEILLGFGRPSSGRILLDGVNTIDVDPLALRGTSAWIGPDGPLIAGTLEDNLHQRKSASLVELTEAVRDAGVYDAIQNLSDGLTTLVSPHDDRLKPDYLFRLGIARTLVKNPTLVVAEEPTARVLPQVEAETLEALHQMTRRGMFVVVLPNRLTTLRHAHQIVVLHENRVSAIGTHAELLEQSELYRHLNYIRFSPLRHILA